MQDFLRFDGVSFAYPGMPDPLFAGVTAQFDRGWTGIVGANGCGKTTLLRVACGELEPSAGSVIRPESRLCVAQRTDEPPELVDEFFESADAEAWQARVDLGIGDDWPGRWNTLSHGERKRLQVAVALWRAPGLLALDEPTNHLDLEAKRVLAAALRAYRGTGLLVSHDRELLDSLCSRCLFIIPPRATMRPGGVTAGVEQDRREQTAARAMDDAAKHAAARYRAAAQERREEGERMAARTKEKAKRSKPGKWDHDGKNERNMAKLSGKDAWAGKQSAALAKRASKAQASRAAFAVRKEFATGFWLEDADVSRRDFVLRLPAGRVEICPGRALVHPALEMKPYDRVALTGANGLGKSTLLRRLVGLFNVPPEHVTYVPQEITAAESAEILAEAKKLPDDRLGEAMTRFSRLGSRPGRLLGSERPSPGEVRKLLLALGIARGPHVVAMDEPTNHMDLPGIECLEEALAGAPCALLLVSHDERFLSRLCRVRWDVSETAPGVAELRVSGIDSAI
ncbi:MAG: ABC-F family ATP-binding cassette domain-containing protein [Kiritimatiellae bacterium]|nr:ABC-F family ATP-binding cassette domain-containing protein [Kiritimatiellia bacterium]